jgi:hypothetical protein
VLLKVKKMELTIELNGIKYLLVEELATVKNQKEINAKIKKYGAIYQGIKEINTGGFWGGAYGVIKVLVPEKSIVAYNLEDL